MVLELRGVEMARGGAGCFCSRGTGCVEEEDVFVPGGLGARGGWARVGFVVGWLVVWRVVRVVGMSGQGRLAWAGMAGAGMKIEK